MNSTASQSSNSGCDGASDCVPRSSLVLTSPVPKYDCQTRLTIERAVVGDCGSTSQRANVSRVGGAFSGKRMQERRHAWLHRVIWLEKVAALQASAFRAAPRVRARPIATSPRDAAATARRSWRWLPGIRHGRPPVAEQRGRPAAACARRPERPRPRARCAGSGSAVGLRALVTETRNRPRLWFWLSSLFQPP